MQLSMRRRQQALIICRLLVGSSLLVLVACGSSTSPGASTAFPTPPPATPGPSPTATINPILSRNRAQGCDPQAPSPLAGEVRTGHAPGTTAPTPREVAITFDDGLAPSSTPAILSFLEQTQTPATFFLIGRQAQQWPALVQREWNDGFALGNHTWDHPEMENQTATGMWLELSKTQQAIHSAIGAQACIWFWRPPYEDVDGAVVKAAQSLGLTTVTWDVDPADWSRPGADVIVARVLTQVHPGAIILLHDGGGPRDQTLAALPGILAGLHSDGLTPVTLPRLLADGGYPGVAIAA